MLEVTTYDRSHFRIITIIVYTIPIYSVMSQTTPSVSLTNPNVQANYGSSVTVGCVVSANPAATSVYWQKIVGNNAPITIDMSNTAKYTGATVANPSLQINNLNTNDQAKYICFAANSVGTGQSTQGTLTVVGSPPVVTMPMVSYTINIGNSITIACSITSNPAYTSVYWTRRIGNNQEEQISTTGQSSSKYSGSTVNSPSLVIYSVQFSDAGQYNCHATNIVGTGHASTPTNLNVVGSTQLVLKIPVNCYQELVGNSITLACQVSSPNSALQSVQWTFTNQNGQVTDPVVISSPKYSGSTTTSPSLTINNVQFSDEGTYRCRATNLIETTTSTDTAILDIYKNKQEQNSTVFVAVISALAVALVTSIIVIVICWLKRKTAEKSTIGGQKRRSETYEARSGEHHSHLYDTIDTYERLSVQQNTNGISVTNINGTSNSSPDYQTESIELYHRYTEIT